MQGQHGEGSENAQEDGVGSGHDHDDTGDLERSPSRLEHGSGSRSDQAATAEQAGGIDRFHRAGVEERRRRVHEGHASDGTPIQGSFPGMPGGVVGSFEYRESDFPPPSELDAFNQIEPGLAREIVDMVRNQQQAQIDAQLIPLKAEALALKAATIGVAFFPWLTMSGAIVLAITGYDVAAVISGIAGVVTIGPQVIAATRRNSG